MELEHFPTSITAQRMMSRISPIYDRSYVGKWIFQIMGMEWDQVRSRFEELRLQTFPETATWAIAYWEQRYDMTPKPNASLEERRKALVAKRCTRTPMNPTRMKLILETLTEVPVIITENIAPYAFSIEFAAEEHIEILDVARALALKIKPSHLVLLAIYRFPIYTFIEQLKGMICSTLEFRTWFSNFAVVLLNGRRKLDGSWTLCHHLPGLPFPRLAMRFSPFQNRERLTQIFGLYGQWHAHPETFRFPTLTLVSSFEEVENITFPTWQGVAAWEEWEGSSMPTVLFRGLYSRQALGAVIPALALVSSFREREQFVFPTFHAAAPFVEQEAVSIPSILFRGFYGRQMLGAAVPALTLGSLFREIEQLTFPAFGMTAAFLEKREAISAPSVQIRVFRAHETETLKNKTFCLSPSVFHTGNTAAFSRFYWNSREKHKYQTMAGTLVQDPTWQLNGKHKLDGTRRLNGAKHNTLKEVL